MSMAGVGEVGRWVRTLYLVALGVFLVTIVIGIVTGSTSTSSTATSS